MIEEIKSKEVYIGEIKEYVLFPSDVYEILDKYDNQPDYKSAWEEFRHKYFIESQVIMSSNAHRVLALIEELEQKYNLGGE